MFERTTHSRASSPSLDRIVTAWFDRSDTANRAYIDLKAAGIDPARITVLAPQSTARHDVAITAATKAPEGGIAGAAVGAGVGVVAGALIVAGSVLVPGIGWIAGPLVGALMGAGAGGVTGGIVGTLVGAGMPEHEAKVVEDTLRQGGIVIAVHATDRHIDSISRILKDNGGRSLTRS